MKNLLLIITFLGVCASTSFAQSTATKTAKTAPVKSAPKQKGKFSFETDADCFISLNGKEMGNLKSGKTRLCIGFVGENNLEVTYGNKATPGSGKPAKKDPNATEVILKKTISLPDTGITTYVIRFYDTEQLNNYLREGNKKMIEETITNNPKSVKPEGDDVLNPLIIAINKKDATLVKMLMDKGADPNLVTGSTPLNTAITTGKADIVKSLIDGGANVNARGEDGKMPLEEAVFWGKYDVVKMLLEKGANANEKDAKGVSLIDIATDKGYDSIVNELKNYGAK